jgi:transposase
MGGACSTNWEEEKNAYRLLLGEPEGKIPLGRPRSRWVDNIKMDLGEIRRVGMDWFDVGQDRDKWRTLVTIKCWEVLE